MQYLFMHFTISSTLVCVFEVSIVDNNPKSAEGHNKNWYERVKTHKKLKHY